MAEVYEKQKIDYTEGSIIQSILKMGTPSMIGFLAGHIYHLVDMLIAPATVKIKHSKVVPQDVQQFV